jgi:RsiW-degrading membrane proteinase PrsW (M82 family)
MPYLLFIALALFTYLAYGDFIEARDIKDQTALSYQRKAVFWIALMLSAAFGIYWLIRLDMFGAYSLKNQWFTPIVYALFAFAISFFWFLYFRALDIFEVEKSKTILILFLLACGSTFLVFPVSNLVDSWGLVLNGEFVNDFLYCTLRIGMVEELAKILPFLLLLRFSKAINEPYDYILYAAVCALGFAFVENILYLSRTQMIALTGRAFYSSISHVFDSSIIGYCLAIAHYKKTNMFVAFVKGLALASLAHGFYDFWLISETYSFTWLTILFFLASIHLLTGMINNLLNISPYYKAHIRLRAGRYKFYLTVFLVGLCTAGFVFILFQHGAAGAAYFAENTALWQSYVLVYLVISFSSLNVVHGYLAPLFSRRNFLFPLINRYPNYRDLKVDVRNFVDYTGKEPEAFQKLLPMDFRMDKRVVVEGDFNWYYLIPTESSNKLDDFGIQLIGCPQNFRQHLKNGKPQMCHLAFITDVKHVNMVELEKDQLNNMGKALMRWTKAVD